MHCYNNQSLPYRDQSVKTWVFILESILRNKRKAYEYVKRKKTSIYKRKLLQESIMIILSFWKMSTFHTKCKVLTFLSNTLVYRLQNIYYPYPPSSSIHHRTLSYPYKLDDSFSVHKLVSTE